MKIIRKYYENEQLLLTQIEKTDLRVNLPHSKRPQRMQHNFLSYLSLFDEG